MADRSRREAWIDGLKGFAILLVILGHVLSGYLDADTFPGAYGSFYPVRTWIYSFHMPLFFFISGFTFSLAYWRDGRLRRDGFFRQMFNLLWIYVVFALLQWLVKQAVPDLVNEPYDLRDLRRMFLEPLGNFWYLYVLFVIYALAAATRLPKWPLWWLLLPAMLAVMAADLHLDWTNLTVYRIVYHFFFFALGSLFRRKRWLLSWPKLAGLSAMCLSLAAYYYVFWYVRNWYANWKISIAVSTCILLVYLFYGCRPLAENRFLQRCGRQCLELYLLHTFFTAGFRSLLPMVGIRGPWISVWLNFALSTGLCLLLAAGAEKAPWTDLLFHPARFFGRLRPIFRRRERP